MDQMQEKIVTDMEASAPEPKAEKAPRLKKEKKIKLPGKGEKFKLSKFDFILLQLLKEGKTDFGESRKTFNLDMPEFSERLLQLRDANYLTFDEAQNRISISMRSINDYSPKWKKAADEWLGRKEKKTRQKAQPLEKTAEPEIMTEQLDLSKTIRAKLPLELLYKELETRHAKILELPEDKRAEETIDIMDLMKKYGPTDAQKDLLTKKSPFVERYMNKNGQKAEEKTKKADQPKGQMKTDSSETEIKPDNPAAAKPYYNRAISDLSRQAAELEASGEKCELCKTGFLISVKAGEHNPKYGHCFCGAPYHKDCYEGITAGDGKCVKCGRKMAAGSDFKMEEAFKQIRDISF
ncbi:MAG: hypothetical protein V1835_06315 [Candidatus Micrarchaeota archaeon]